MSIATTARQAGWQQGWILVLAGFLPVMAIIALAPTIPTLLAHFKNVPNAQLMVPLLVTAPSACIALFAPLAGVLADRAGRRNLMLASMMLYGMGGIVPFVMDSFWAVVAGRLLIGVAEAGILTVTNTLLADYFEERVRHRWLMIQGIAGALLGSVMIASSGFLAALGWQWPFAVYAVAFPIFIASVFYLYEPQLRAKTKSKAEDAVSPTIAVVARPFPWAIAGLLCGATAALSTIYFVQVIHFSLVLKELGVVNPKAIGLIMSLPSIGVPMGSVVFKLTTRWGHKVQIGLVLLCYAVGLTGIGLATNFQTALAFAFFQQLANGIIVPALIAWAQSLFTFEHRGRGMGLWASSFFIAQFISPVVVSLVRQQVGGLQPAFVVFGLLSLVGALLAVANARRPAQLNPQHS